MDSKTKEILQKFSSHTNLATEKVELALVNDAEEVSSRLMKASLELEREAKGLRSNIARAVNDYYELEERFKIASKLEQQLMRSFKDLGVDYRSQPIAKQLAKALETYKTLGSPRAMGSLLKI